MSLFCYSLAILCMEHFGFWGAIGRPNFSVWGGYNPPHPPKTTTVKNYEC